MHLPELDHPQRPPDSARDRPGCRIVSHDPPPDTRASRRFARARRDRLPANKNVKWALGSNLWNYFPRVPFTDILDVMRDTGFIGMRLTQFPQILKTYNITAAQMQKEAPKRGCHIVTISFNGPAHDPAKRADVVASAKTAMTFLKEFGAKHLVVFSPNRRYRRPRPRRSRRMCEMLQRDRRGRRRDGIPRRPAQSHGADRAERRMRWTAAWR